MKCEICKEKMATKRKTLPFSSYLYDVCDGCFEDLDKTEVSLQNQDGRKCIVCGKTGPKVRYRTYGMEPSMDEHLCDDCYHETEDDEKQMWDLAPVMREVMKIIEDARDSGMRQATK